MQRFLVVAMLVLGCGDGDPSKPSLDAPWLGNGCETAGGHCDFVGWCAPTVCDEFDHQLCWCGDHTIQCEPVDVTACADLPAGYTCEIEGSGECDGEPPGGGECDCASGTWQCHNSCDGCPEEPPATGDPCAVTHGCGYTTETCTCNAATFSCQ